MQRVIGAQEDVEELKREYRAAVNALGASLSEKDIQKACGLAPHVQGFKAHEQLLPRMHACKGDAEFQRSTSRSNAAGQMNATQNAG